MKIMYLNPVYVILKISEIINFQRVGGPVRYIMCESDKFCLAAGCFPCFIIEKTSDFNVTYMQPSFADSPLGRLLLA